MSDGRRLVLRALPVVVLWVGFWLCLHNAWVPFGQRFRVAISDDAYYVFGVARHVALGEPPSIDGVRPTNGVHPLWTAMLVPVFALFRGGEDFETPISIALTLGALFHLAGGALLWRIMRRLGLSYGASLVALAYFSGNAYQIANAVGGLESALATAAMLLAFLAYLRARESLDDAHKPWLFGLACGAAILARTDQVLIVGVLFLALLPAARAGGGRRAARWLLVAGGACAATLVPWMAYTWATTGTVVQSSGLALSLVHRRMPEAWGGVDTLALRLEQVAGCLGESYWLLQRALQLSPIGLPALVALAGIGVLAEPERPRSSGPLARQLVRAAPLLAGLLILFAVHVCVRLSLREWYTSPFVAGAAFLVALDVDWIGRRIGRGFGPELAAVASMLALAWPLYAGYAEWRSLGLWGSPGEQPKPEEGKPKDRTAFTDCGLASYYAGYGVTNLDGLTNQAAYEALRDRDLISYIRGQRFERVGITAVMHSPAFLGRRYREWLVSINRNELGVVGTAAEKDERIGPRAAPYALAALDGRELLGDGWIWPQGEAPTVRSIGPYSELIFALPARPAGGELVLEARAIAFGPDGTQPTTFVLNGVRLGTVGLRPEPVALRLPLAAGRVGRNRLTLEYASPQAVRRRDDRGWYRSLEGNASLAIEAASLSLPGGLR